MTTRPEPALRLLEVEPDLGEHLSPEELELADRIILPVVTLLRQDVDLDAVLASAGAFAAAVADGMLMHRMAIVDQPALRLLGPGDIIPRSAQIRSALLTGSQYRAPGRLRLALLDDRVLAAGRHIPRLFAALQIRMGEQYHRLATQLAVCQLPRVEDRLLALMWLLAESWGRVTPNGTIVPLALTHDALGELVGARRPTVTLALKELSDRGAVFRQDSAWLLLEPPPVGPRGRGGPQLRAEPRLVTPAPARWGVRDDEPPSAEADLAAIASRLLRTVEGVRASHQRHAQEVGDRLAQSRQVRDESRQLRARLAAEKLTRPTLAPRR